MGNSVTTGTGQVASTASSAKATTAMVTHVVAPTASRHLCAEMQLLTKENSVITVIKLAVPQVALLTLATSALLLLAMLPFVVCVVTV